MANIAISGASGRMGLNLIKACLLNPSASLGAAIEHKDAASLGKDVGDIAGLDAQGLQVSADLQSQLPNVDVLVDFTRPDGDWHHRF